MIFFVHFTDKNQFIIILRYANIYIKTVNLNYLPTKWLYIKLDP